MSGRPLIWVAIAAACAIGGSLGGCAQLSQNTGPQASSQQPVMDDDAYCQKEGAPGSSAYVACRKNRDVASSRAASSDRYERAHKDMAERMLNGR
jgi:hypothetical protein